MNKSQLTEHKINKIMAEYEENSDFWDGDTHPHRNVDLIPETPKRG